MRFRISLRTLFLLVLAVAVVIGGVGRYRQYQREHVLITVVDSATGSPLAKFLYKFITETPTDQETSGWLDQQSSDGQLWLKIPESCNLTLFVESRQLGTGYPKSVQEYTLTREGVRKFAFAAEAAMQVEGIVTDKTTGLPIEGVKVAPMDFYNPASVCLQRYATKTNENGYYSLKCVKDHGIAIYHDKYRVEQRRFNSRGPRTRTRDIPLSPAKLVRGRVIDEAGEAVANVHLHAHGPVIGKETRTNEQGEFEIYAVYFDSPIQLSASGQMIRDKTFDRQETDSPLELVVTRNRPGVLTGIVVDGQQKPVTTYKLIVAPTGNRFFPRTTEKLIEDPNGEFRVEVEDTGDYWLLIKAAGFQFCEHVIATTSPDDISPVKYVLSPGFTVNGRFTRREQDSGHELAGVASLMPLRVWEVGNLVDDDAHKLITLEAKVTDGQFRFTDVNAGVYELRSQLAGMSPVRRVITVEGDTTMDDLSARPSSLISGQIFIAKDDGGGFDSFRRGKIYHRELDDPILFTTDEKGRFRVANVPAGKATVAISEHHGDLGYEISRRVRVAPGGSQHVTFHNPDRSRTVPVDLRIPGVSDVLEEVILGKLGCDFEAKCLSVPASCDPEANMDRFKQPSMFICNDFSEGEFDLTVRIGNGQSTVDYSRRIKVEFPMQPVVITIDTGTIRGKVPRALHVPPRSNVSLVSITRGRKIGAARVERNDGTFAFPRLPPGDYIVVLDGRSFVATSHVIRVGSDTVECMVSKVVGAVGSVTGRITRAGIDTSPYKLMLKNDLHINRTAFVDGLEAEPFRMENIPPGNHTLQLVDFHGNVLKSQPISMAEGEKLNVEF